VVAVATPPPPPLLLLHDHLVFRDFSAGRSGVPLVLADGGILVDVDRRVILWERNPHLPHAPASTAKLLTSLVALDNLEPSQMVTVTPDALTQASDETVMGLQPGQRLSVADLLTGMLTASGNDAATALAADTFGLERFVDAMNQQVAALGLTDSHFVTPVGLDNPAQRASAYDLAAIATEDMTHFPLFAQIVATRDTILPATADHPTFALHNLNRLLSLYPPAVGIKPGWTEGAGPSLVAMAQRGGHRLLAVLLNEPQHMYAHMRDLLQWGFAQYGIPPIAGLPPA